MKRDAERVDAELAVADPAPAARPVPELPVAATEPASGGTLSRATVMALQQSAGNAAVARMLQRQPVLTPPGPTTSPAQEGYDTARKERETFISGGKKGPQTYNPSASNKDNYYGGFDVEYDPAKGELLVMLKGAAQEAWTLLTRRTCSAGSRARSRRGGARSTPSTAPRSTGRTSEPRRSSGSTWRRWRPPTAKGATSTCSSTPTRSPRGSSAAPPM